MTEYFLKAFGRESTISVKTQIEEEFTEAFFKELATACANYLVSYAYWVISARTYSKTPTTAKPEEIGL